MFMREQGLCPEADSPTFTSSESPTRDRLDEQVVQVPVLQHTGWRGWLKECPPFRPTRAPNFDALRSEFRRLRSESGMSYDALAEKTGVSRRTLISVENGQSNGSVETWYRITDAFGISMSDLMATLDRTAGKKSN